MPSVRFLVPGTTGRYRCGGLSVELQSARLVSEIAPVEVVTYRQREAAYPFFADLLRQEPVGRNRGLGDLDGLRQSPADPLWIVSWGFDVPKLLRQLRGRPVAYHAHSSGYGFDLPPGVPVLAVSRNTMGYWGDRAPRNPLLLIPNALERHWFERGARGSLERRPIDVLVQQRKTSAYVLHQLVPALCARGLRVEVQSGWVDDLVQLFNSATVYLYDSADYWRGRGVSEGFGLPPIEALACGCLVFSSLNHALADLLDPGLIGEQIGCGSLQADVERIAEAVRAPQVARPDPQQLDQLLDGLREEVLQERWRQALEKIHAHWQLSRYNSGSMLRSPSLLVQRCRMAREAWCRRFRFR